MRMAPHPDCSPSSQHPSRAHISQPHVCPGPLKVLFSTWNTVQRDYVSRVTWFSFQYDRLQLLGLTNLHIRQIPTLSAKSEEVTILRNPFGILE